MEKREKWLDFYSSDTEFIKNAIEMWKSKYEIYIVDETVNKFGLHHVKISYFVKVEVIKNDEQLPLFKCGG